MSYSPRSPINPPPFPDSYGEPIAPKLNNKKGGNNMGLEIPDLPDYPVEPPRKVVQTIAKEIKPRIQEEVLAIEKQYQRCSEFVNVYVNGDPISQLFVKHDLTEKAQEELIKLQEATSSKNISLAKRELEALKQEITGKHTKVNELNGNISELEAKKEALSKEIEALKKRKRLLTESIISDLPYVKSSDDDSTVEWRRDVVGWERIWDSVSEKKPKDFDSIINSYISEYVKTVGCSREEAVNQFYYISPRIEEVSEYIKTHLNDLAKYDTFSSWYNLSEENSYEEEICKFVVHGIYKPVYKLVKSYGFVKKI